MTDALLHEIERVIFEAHALGDRDGTVDFQELRELRTARFREARKRDEEALADISDRIGAEREKIRLVQPLKKQIEEKTKLVEGYTRDRAKLVSKGGEVRARRLAELTSAAEKVRGYLRYFAAQEQALLSMQDEVGTFRQQTAPETLRRMAERNRASALTPEEWQSFLLGYTGDVDETITGHLARARNAALEWRGAPTAPTADLTTAIVPDDAELDKQALSSLEAEIHRLERQISIDRDTATRFAALSRRISEELAALDRLKERLADCEGAAGRLTALVQERQSVYLRIFDVIIAEEDVLRQLYSPLMARLRAMEGSAKKLAFSVARIADTESWAAAGEGLLDLRVQGPFKGRGTLRQLADASLKAAWQTGGSAAVSDAMAAFRTKNDDALVEHSPIPQTQQADYREWAKRVARWLYGTEHIRIQYSIDYDGVDIRKLSPGTRGIVLLLLYLALDEADDRPLIIDQPEENLDPKSVFDELVALFVAAKAKRQVIMVTHNANLVVNTNADQVIIAKAGHHMPGKLPPLSYLAGGLESESIRKEVCDILEGGQQAFRERARRLRIRLDR